MAIEIFDTGGVSIFNTENITSGIVADVLVVPANTSFSKSYPLLAGCTIKAMLMNAANLPQMAVGESDYVDTVQGYPRFSMPFFAPLDRTYVMWATGTPNLSSFNGIGAVSSNGTVAINPNARGLNFVGVANWTGNSAGGSISNYQINSPSKPVIVPRMYSGFTIGFVSDPVNVGGDLWTFYASRYANSTLYDFPKTSAHTGNLYYCFGRYPTAVTNPTFFINDTDGTLAYDLARPGLLRATRLLNLVTNQPQTISGLPAQFGVLGAKTFFASGTTQTVEGQEETPIFFRYEYEAGISLSGNQVTKAEYLSNYFFGYGIWTDGDYYVDYDNTCAIIDLANLQF